MCSAKLVHFLFPDHLFSTFITILICPQPSIITGFAESAPEPLSCLDVNQNGRQNYFRCPQVRSWFPKLRKVLWLSSSSPASSLVNPCTPLWSSPALSVGAARHTVSMRPALSHDCSPSTIFTMSNQQNRQLAWRIIRNLSDNTLMHQWQWHNTCHSSVHILSKRWSVSEVTESSFCRIQFCVHTGLKVVSE